METLLSKRRAAAARGLPDETDTAIHSEWRAVEEGFRLLERDLGKLQVRASLRQIMISINLSCQVLRGNQCHWIQKDFEEV
jgi:hypothetical protein